MSVGLLVVRLLYCFYVFGHLSKWFTFSVFLSVIFCRVVVFYACTQRFAAWRSGGLLAQKFNRRTTLEPTTKLSYEALHPPLRQAAVICRFSSVIIYRFFFDCRPCITFGNCPQLSYRLNATV